LKVVRIIVLALALFLAFTPFEWPGTYYAVAIGVLAPLLAIVLVHPASVAQALQKPNVAWWLIGAATVHMLVLRPAPFLMTVGLLAAGVGAAALARFGTHFRATIGTAIHVVLVVQVAGLAIQAMTLMTTGEAAALHSMLFPPSEARTGVESVGVIRLGGFQIEPGTYAAWVAMLVALSRIWKGRFGVIDYVATASILGTYSAMGIAFVTVLGAWALFDRLSTFRFLQAVGGLTIAALIGFWAATLGVATYLENRFLETPEETSVQIREKPLREWVEADAGDKVVGFGFKRADCTADICARELGFGFNILSSGGILGALGLAIFALFLASHSPPDKLVELAFAIVVALMAKAAPSAIAPWLVLFALADVNRARRRRAEAEAAFGAMPRPGIGGPLVG
jgi:hypothetical protein